MSRGFPDRLLVARTRPCIDADCPPLARSRPARHHHRHLCGRGQCDRSRLPLHSLTSSGGQSRPSSPRRCRGVRSRWPETALRRGHCATSTTWSTSSCGCSTQATPGADQHRDPREMTVLALARTVLELTWLAVADRVHSPPRRRPHGAAAGHHPGPCCPEVGAARGLREGAAEHDRLVPPRVRAGAGVVVARRRLIPAKRNRAGRGRGPAGRPGTHACWPRLSVATHTRDRGCPS